VTTFAATPVLKYEAAIKDGSSVKFTPDKEEIAHPLEKIDTGHEDGYGPFELAPRKVAYIAAVEADEELIVLEGESHCAPGEPEHEERGVQARPRQRLADRPRGLCFRRGAQAWSRDQWPVVTRDCR
jgi:hypothetical protein